MPAPFNARVRARLLLVVAALHACARLDVAAAQVAEGLFRDGNTLVNAGRYAEARAPYLRAATEFQHAGAQHRVGRLYWLGLGVTANNTEGVRWYAMSSAQGYDLAHTRLGFAFERGEGGLAADVGEAVRLYTLGAAQGEMLGLLFLGVAHSSGQGPLAVSKPVALGLYERAARQGHGPTQYAAAARLFQGGGGIPQDYTMAYFWALLAARGGYAPAETKLPDYEARCTGACRAEAEALADGFKPQDPCAASLFNRTNFCGGSGEPTPE